MKRIGILGGTFDPVHKGHLLLAKEAKRLANLDEVIFMPAKLQPFKLDKKVTPPEHRLAMLKLAISGTEGFSVSEYELNSSEISYTCNTMRAMSEAYPEDLLFFIMGTDAFLKVTTWKGAEELLTGYNFIVGARPGYREEELSQCIDKIRDAYNTDIVRVDSPMLNISSTEIRNAEGKGMITPEVERYIKAHDLY